MGPRNNLSIRLSESVVFLRGSAETTITGRRTTRDAPPALLRGLLTLSLDKPTKISSIEITLEGKSVVSWPEGAGTRKLEITEENEIFSATTVFFRAGQSQLYASRRTASVGPGLVFDHEEIDDETISNEGASYQSHLFRPIAPSHRRRVSMDYQFMRRAFTNELPTPPYSPPETRPGSLRTHESNQLAPMTSPPAAQRASSWLSSGSIASRAREHSEVPHSSPRGSQENYEPRSSSSSLAEGSLSRRVSYDNESVHERSLSRGRTRLPAVLSNGTPTALRTPSISTAPSSPLVTAFPPSYHQSPHNSMSNSASNSTNNSASILPSSSRVADGEARVESSSPHRERGRRHARFSLASVSNAILDAVKERVRSNSRQREGKERAVTPNASRDHSPEGSSRARGSLVDQSIDLDDDRGRRMSREEGNAKHKEKERSTFGRITGALGLSSTEINEGESWKEFRKGTYTYPISFAIPGDSPPSLECDFGTVKYRLKAVVHRPGTFTPRLSATQEVTLIASPGEDDVDETDNIVVQREWDSQMHYLIIISGREFPIGSSIPIHITFMPISKVKIFRISALLEEKITYYTQCKSITRAEPVRKFELLSCRYHEKDSPPILPLISDFTNSPLRGFVDATDDSEAASSLMGPGPWSIQAMLQLPKSCSLMHFTNKHKRSSINIAHTLKIVFRVERGDDQFVDAKSGRRKHFDIVVQTPMHILSCRCNPEWTSLPRYSRLELSSISGTQTCPCTQVKDEVDGPDITIPPPVTTPIASTSYSHYSPFHAFFHPFELHEEPSTMEVQTLPGSVYSGGQSLSRLSSEVPADLASLYRRNTQFARLVAGEESEAGEPPPQYDSVASMENASGAQAISSSVSAGS